MIKLTGIEKSYRAGSRRVSVLRGVSFEVTSGEFVAITGASGSGKSTLLNILGLLDVHDGGTYELDGIPIGPMSETKAAEWRNLYIGFVFQSFHLLPFKTALENVELPLAYRGLGKKERCECAIEMLDKVGLRGRADHFPGELSGGERQRVAMARALVTRPRILLADEPTGALDSQTSARVMDMFEQINLTGMTMVVVTHEPSVAARARRVIRMRDGLVADPQA